jgi:hypothetical protein
VGSRFFSGVFEWVHSVVVDKLLYLRERSIVLQTINECLLAALWGTLTNRSRADASPEIIVLMMLAAGAHTNFLAPV